MTWMEFRPFLLRRPKEWRPRSQGTNVSAFGQGLVVLIKRWAIRRPKSLDPKEAQRLQKEFAKAEKERRRRSAKLNSSKIKRESAFVYMPSMQAGGDSSPFITERLSTNSGSAAQELFDGRTLRQFSPTAVPLQPLATMRPRSMCIRELAATALAEPTTGDTSPTPPPVIDDGIPPALPPRE